MMTHSKTFPANTESRSGRVRYLTIAVLGCLMSVTGAYAQTSYSITDLGVLPGLAGSTASGINDRGDITGSSVTPMNQPTGFLLRDGVMVSIGKLPSGTYSQGMSVNFSGYVVGCGDSTTPESQALLFRNNTLTNIAPNSSNNVCAIYINDAGTIVGDLSKGRDASAWIPQIWVEDPTKPGRFRATSLNPFAGDTLAYAAAANQSIQVVGNTSSQSTGTRGVMWNNDSNHTSVLLKPIPGDMQSAAYAVNNIGAAAGISWFGVYHSSPVVWSPDSTHTPSALPLLAGDDHGFADGINNSGQVIGYSGVDAAGRGVTPVTWINGQVFALQSMLDASGAGWQLTSVAGINNLGLIVGTGSHNGVQRGFVLTPNVP